MSGAKEHDRISVLAYAQKLGCTHTAINKAIREKKINKGYDPVSKKIIVEIADKEFGMAFKERRDAKGKLKGNRDNGIEFNNTNEPTDENINKWDGGDIPNNVTYAEALRIQAIIKARREQVSYLEELGALVDKEQIAQQLYVAGSAIRKLIERWGLVLVDGMREAESRDDALDFYERESRKLLNTIEKSIEEKLSKQEDEEQ